MIKRLQLKNFQGHEDSELEFSPGLNIITGPSDNGKSSIIRAIEWVRSNRPKGSEFIRIGKRSATVEVETENVLITRERDDKSTGSYSIITEDMEDEFSVVGSDVPVPVITALNLSDINIQLQLDGHFLILDTPGKCAAYLNEITKLDKLSNAVAKLKSMKLSETTNQQQIKKELDEVNEYLDSGILNFHLVLETLYNDCIQIDNEINELRMKVNTVQRLVNQNDELEKTQIDDEDLNGINDILNEFSIEMKEYGILTDQISEVKSLLNTYIETDDNLIELNDGIGKIDSQIKIVYSQLNECPYCGSKLNDKTRGVLLHG
jgi:exonuclease SbcC